MGLVTLAADFGLRHYLRLVPPITRFILHEIVLHKAVAVFSVIALEEMGVPLPLPGDLFIAFAGHIVARGTLNPVSAFVAIVGGAVVGSSVLFFIARRYGQPFIRRYGPYMHIKPGRLQRVERAFQRWGPLVIIVGRHVPGFRMVISVFAGVLGIRWPVFVGSVAISASIWAVIFLSLGAQLDRRLGPYLTITPAHLVPSTLFIVGSITYGLVVRRRARRAEAARLRLAEGSAPS